MTADDAQFAATEKLAAMIAASVAFQTEVAEQSEFEASAHVHYPYILDPDQTAKPWAAITPGIVNYTRVAGGGQNYLTPDGTLKLALAAYANPSDSESVQFAEFARFTGKVIAEIAEIAGVDDNLAVTDIRQTVEASSTHPKDSTAAGKGKRPYWFAEFEVAWNTF